MYQQFFIAAAWNDDSGSGILVARYGLSASGITDNIPFRDVIRGISRPFRGKGGRWFVLPTTNTFLF